MVKKQRAKVVLLVAFALATISRAQSPHTDLVFAASLLGDFNNDLTVNLTDFNLLLPALHTTNAKFALTGSDNYYVDLFDYNEFLKTLGSSAAPTYGTKSLNLACQLTTPQPKPGKMLNVGTWNIGKNGEDMRDDDMADRKAIAVGQKFKEYKLDIMILQEVHILRTRTGSDPITNTNLPTLVQSQVPDKLYFYSVYQNEVKHSLVIISKFPALETESFNIDGGRKVNYAQLDTPVGRLKVFDTHLPNKGEVFIQCNSMRKATDYARSKTQPGDNFIIGGDFNLDYENGFYTPYNQSDGDIGRHYCTDDQSATRVFDISCSSTPCHYTRAVTPQHEGVADYILGGAGGYPRMYQYCYLGNWGMYDAHPMLVGTIEMP